MTKRILVYTYGDQSHKQTIDIASKFAAEQNAHLTGIYIKPDYINFSKAYGSYMLAVLDTLPKKLATCEQKNQQDFEQSLTKYGASGEWHSMDEMAPGPNPALYVDCIFISQAIDKDVLMINGFDFIDQQILSTGLPIILVPANWQSDTFAHRPVLGWKESKEAAGAVRHALPFLQRAEQVDVISIAHHNNDPDKQLIDGIQIGEFLSAHSVNNTFDVVTMRKQDKNEADTLIDYVNRNNNDLIVIGSYSHTRLREIFFGGMTRALIRECPVPVLLAH